MTHIASVAKESEHSQENLKDEFKDEMQVAEVRLTTQVDSMRDVVDYLGISNVIVNIGLSDIYSEPIILILDVTIVVAPPSDDAASIPWFYFIFFMHNISLVYLHIFIILVVWLFCDI